jgi:hypothetical protein
LAVADVLGLFLMCVFIVCVISLAAGITWLVVRYTPSKRVSQKTG